MQNITIIKDKTVLSLVAILMVTNLYSRSNTNDKKGKENVPTLAAGCAPARAKATLSLNNVRTRIEGTGGSMWLDRDNVIADYEVPKRNEPTDPKRTSIFAGALWMGGVDAAGQLKIAAVTFRNSGNDFWPGPLDTVTAEVSAETCVKFDRFYGVSRAMIDEFNAWYECSDDPTCDESIEFSGYKIPTAILEWPAHGDLTLKQDWHLAPFFDRDGDDFYDPNSGDYPKYDLVGEIDCRTQRDIRLFGDTTIWFVFNDKGNVHTESEGPSIGMEIRGQAFAFATNDEVNNMTFYNYEMINRSTFTLQDTYFGQWVDADLGFGADDYVGCDASRGLGYCYNGDNNDEDAGGVIGYGTTPPVVGVDFFEGPFADADGIDNPLTQVIQDALDSNGIPYPGLGIGYGDGIIDNERYGMRKFVYYNRGTTIQGDPQTALDHYNYLKGIWRDGSTMVWGRDAHFSSGGTTQADLMFPGDSDPLFWSTRGINATPSNWTELNGDASGNQNVAFDRRFLESAGPFTLEPGAVNDLTVGVVWARALSGNNFASISNLEVADDKAQALFDNCFDIVEGPDAPDLTFQELNQELILYLTNRSVSNNFNESYNQLNPFIAIPDTLNGVPLITKEAKDSLRFYKFQGYQIYQLKNGSITVSEIDDPSKSRLVAQVDIKDEVTQLINYTFDENLKANVPKEMVKGEDKGIRHSFRVTEDLFASGETRLVNHKTYYYLAVAYGYNEFKHYDPLDPFSLDGQTLPYIASRKMGGGQGISSFSAIPHNPVPEEGGTNANSAYGDMPQITRKEGQGNGGNELELTAASEASIVANNFMDFPTYKSGKGPIQVKVIDPLNVKLGVHQVQFKDTTGGNLDDAYWSLLLPDGSSIDADQSIAVENEQLFLEQGISITIKQVAETGINKLTGNGVIGSSIEYEDPAQRWLGGFSDVDGETDANWIKSGSSVLGTGQGSCSGTSSYVPSIYDDYFTGRKGCSAGINKLTFPDPESSFERLINGTWAPYGLLSYSRTLTTSTTNEVVIDAVGSPVSNGASIARNVDDLSSVDVVFTSDKSKWSRAMVLEARNNVILTVGGAKHIELRKSPSVDKSGRTSSDAGYNSAEGDLVSTTGMGWFPGYAINLETGERLNVAFAEDSWLVGENGRDMVWNPTSNAFAGVNNELVMGGKHYVYVFKKKVSLGTSYPIYDESSVLYGSIAGGDFSRFGAFRTCIWAGIPMLQNGYSLIETTAKVRLRVDRPYEKFTTSSTFNASLPLYEFDMTGLEVELNNEVAIDSALSTINVVPNPYYAYSEYEVNTLDKRIKITNLPEICTISIYNVSGTLMRRFQKGDPKTSLDWDLTNSVNVPIASGVYLIHIKVPDVGERTLKWYGLMKPTDFNGL